jgi:hypothetical protein
VGGVLAIVMGVGLLTSTFFWAGCFFFLAGWCGQRTGARWITPVIAGFYVSHMEVIQALFGDRGPFLLRNWMAAGLASAVVILGSTAAALVRTWRRPTRLQLTYTGAVLFLMVLAVLTTRPTSFGTRSEYATEYLGVWLGLGLVAVAVALEPQFQFEPFAITVVGLGYSALFFVPGFWVSGYEISTSQRVALGAVAGVVLFTTSRRKRWLILAAPLALAALLLGKEGSTTAVLLGVGLALAVYYGRLRWFVGIIVASAGALVVWVMVSGWPLVFDNLVHRGLGSRLILYSEATAGWLDNIVFGRSEFGSVVYLPESGRRAAVWTFPHSATLEVLLNWGLVGWIPWATAQVAGIVASLRSGLLPLLLSALALAHFSGNLVNNFGYWVVSAVAVAVSVGFRGRNTAQDEPAVTVTQEHSVALDG